MRHPQAAVRYRNIPLLTVWCQMLRSRLVARVDVRGFEPLRVTSGRSS
jgi:hypothetical protein